MLKLSARILPVLLLALLAACASNKKGDLKSEKDYYQSAQKSLKAGNFSTASDELENLESHYPVGAFTEQAQLDLIYAKYRHLDYAGASAAADRFIRLHPNHLQVDYAYYMKGLADYDAGADTFNRFLPMDPAHRDLNASRDAFNDFRDLLTRFPASQYAPDARQRMVYLRNQFAEYEMHVAQYYMQRGAYVAALARARWVVEGFQGAPVIPDALADEAWCYIKLGMKPEAASTLAILKSNFPDFKGLDKLGRLTVNMGENNEGRSWVNIATFGLFGDNGKTLH
jgi:outer membrane protein assembly factor BamD